MKQRIIALVLILLVCATALLTSPHLILHADPECHQTACPVCKMLVQNDEGFICLLAALVGAGLFSIPDQHFLHASPENRFVPDWTLVRRKVKLLD